MKLEDAKIRFKCFLHYGNEERVYLPCGNLKYSFSPEKVESIAVLLRDDLSSQTLVDTIKKVNQYGTSIAPCALLYALAVIVRTAKKNMEKRNQNEVSEPSTSVAELDKATEIDSSEVKITTKTVTTKREAGVEPKKVHRLRIKTKNKRESDGADPPHSIVDEYASQPWDLIVRDAYKAARKLSEDRAENLFLFTHYLREIAKSEGKRGFGIGWRITIDNWYEYQDAIKLSRSVTKFYEGLTWTHTDLLTLSRWNSDSSTDPVRQARDAVLLFARYNFKSVDGKYRNSTNPKVKEMLKYLRLINDLRHAKTEEQALNVVVNNKEITFDAIPPGILKTSSKIWLNVISRMSPDRLLPLINRLSRSKMFKYPEVVTAVVEKFEEPLQTTIHPMDVFITRKRYEEAPNLAVEFQYIRRRQEIERAQNRAFPDDPQAEEVRNFNNVHRIPPPRRNSVIITSLNSVFNKTISSLAATGKSFLLGMDGQAASNSRRCLYERFVTIEEAVLVVALCVIKAEAAGTVKMVTFTKEPFFFREIPLNKSEETTDSLKSKVFKDDCVNGNVAKLIKYATNSGEKYDVFIILSDNFVVPGEVESALQEYRDKVYSKAKVVTCCFIGRHKKQTELIKPGMLLICGFDQHVPKLIESYSREAFE